VAVMKIEASDLEYANRNFHLNVDHLTVEEGSITGIGGPNGSGKSTLLRLLYGYLKPRNGAVLIDNESMYDMKSFQVARKISVVQQETPTPMNFTVEDIVSMSKYAKPMDSKLLEESLDQCGIGHLRKRKFEELSGGERRLVMIAGALYQGTDIIMLDEPTTFLDVDKELRIVELILSLKRLGKTIILVLHDINLLRRICNTVIMMKDGKVIDQGYPSRMFTPELLEKTYGSMFLSFNTPEGITWVPYTRTTDKQEEILVVEEEYPRLGLSYNLWKNGLAVRSFSIDADSRDIELQIDEIRLASSRYRYVAITSAAVSILGKMRGGLFETLSVNGEILFLVDYENESAMVSINGRENFFRIFGVEKTVSDICHEIMEICVSVSFSYRDGK